MKITGKQIAMARILLDLSKKDLADALGIARKTIMRIENGQSPGSTKTLETIQIFFENHDIVFKGEFGVNKIKQQITKLQGSEGIKAFYDDVYETVKQHGGDMCLFNGVPKRLLKWVGQEWYDRHQERMINIKDRFDYRIIVEEGEDVFVAHQFAEYRWFPKDLFNRKTLHSYHTKLAFFDYEGDEVKILLIDQAEFAESFRVLFDIAWDRVAIKPPREK